MCSILAYCGKSAELSKVQEMLAETTSRGPDDSRIINTGNGYMGFNRLSIMGLTASGMQPFTRKGSAVVCNGEIYGFRPLRDYLKISDYTFESDSDCEILLPLYEKVGVSMFRMLDAEFALVIYDAKQDKYIAARDPIGIRPLYYGYDKDGVIIFASEPKNLVGVCDRIQPFPPGHYYEDGRFICYRDMSDITYYTHDDMDTIAKEIHDRLMTGIDKRLDADAPVGFLLSGGLDSSLVCGAASRLRLSPSVWTSTPSTSSTHVRLPITFTPTIMKSS